MIFNRGSILYRGLYSINVRDCELKKKSDLGEEKTTTVLMGDREACRTCHFDFQKSLFFIDI